mmetsp:Transcript_49713/g.89357  ORF Transcript_49713/g.89357 Transcript_49713/m.89357 type:complete len:818 (-) Transcript_49713:14-2467(-)
MGKAKPVYCTVEELDAAKTELKTLIAKLQKLKADKEEIQPPATKVQNHVDDLKETVEKNKGIAAEAVSRLADDAKAHTDELFENVRQEFHPMFQPLTDARIAGDLKLDEQIKQLDVDLRAAFADELASLCSKIDAEFQAVRQETAELVELRRKDAAIALAAAHAELKGSTDELRTQAAERDGETRRLALFKSGDVIETQNQADQLQDEIREKYRQELDNEIARLDKMLAEAREFSAGDCNDARAEAALFLKQLTVSAKDRFQQVHHRADSLAAWLEVVDQVPTRRIEWLMQGASANLRRPRALLDEGDGDQSPTGELPAYSSYFSPKFNAGGGKDFQLELRVYPATASQAALEADGHVSPGSRKGTGDCGLFLWCPKGMQFSLRFYIADKWMTVEKALGDKTPTGFKRMGFLEDLINREDDTLRVGVELLEVIREISAQVSVSPTLAAITDTEDGGGERKKYLVGDGQEGAAPFDGALTFHRHVNHRVLPQVRKEVEKMQAKMVRRAEWQITNALALLASFPKLKPICSPIFQAAGVEGLQFVFYPNGYTGASEGFCSFFLFCPAGVTMKCQLGAGKQSRDTSNSFKEAAAFGRVNFCRLDSAVDTDTDSLILSLEIEELTQESKKQSNIAGGKAPNKALVLETAAPAPLIGSAVKLVRKVGRETLTEVNQLPGLWTAMALGDMVKKPADYQTYDTLPSKGRPPKGATAQTTEPPRAGKSFPPPPLLGAAATAPTDRGFGTVRSESTPALRSPSADAFMGSDRGPDSLPLLCGPQSEFGADQGHGSPLLWAGRPRKARTASSTPQSANRPTPPLPLS